MRSFVKTTTICALATYLLALLSGAFAQSTSPTSTAAQHSKRTWLGDIAVDPDGSILYIDTGNDQVAKLDKDGKLVWRVSLSTPAVPDSRSFKLTPYSRGMNLYTIYSFAAGIRELDTTDGKLTDVWPRFAIQQQGIPGTDGNRGLYVPNQRKNRVELYEPIMVNVTSDQLKASHWEPRSVTLTDPGLTFPDGLSIPCCLVIDGKAQKGPAAFAQPYMVQANSSGSRIWVLDHSYVFNVFDGAGKFLYELHSPDAKNKSFTGVTDMEFDADGNAYLGCQANHTVLKYSDKGKLLKTITVGRHLCAFGMDKDGNLYVGDDYGYTPPDGTGRTFSAINVFDQEGKLIRLIPVPAD